MNAILFYLAWLSGVLLAAGMLSALVNLWWTLYALSTLDEYTYTTIYTTPLDRLHSIKPLCDSHGISYRWIYAGRLCGGYLQSWKNNEGRP
jgi:hypothetical protein